MPQTSKANQTTKDFVQVADIRQIVAVETDAHREDRLGPLDRVGTPQEPGL